MMTARRPTARNSCGGPDRVKAPELVHEWARFERINVDSVCYRPVSLKFSCSVSEIGLAAEINLEENRLTSTARIRPADCGTARRWNHASSRDRKDLTGNRYRN